jgi:hypothetical protein
MDEWFIYTSYKNGFLTGGWFIKHCFTHKLVGFNGAYRASEVATVCY